MTGLDLFGTVILSGELVAKPVGDTVVVNFTGRTVERTGEKKDETTGQYQTKAHFFYFEIWDSAAQYLATHAKAKDRLLIYSATPRQHTWKNPTTGENVSKVVFRVNRFEIIPYVEKEPSND